MFGVKGGRLYLGGKSVMKPLEDGKNGARVRFFLWYKEKEEREKVM